ncbi:MAG: hypothetical protein CME90_11150 [Hoeflea sp.]|nr:hypothetical protein [Hoeflea sp.]|tara:strand:+ start:8689 stop:8931 length:243 start_codon:yes stop_codon:yes gene_type:complete
MSERLLSAKADPIASEICALLNGLPLNEGLSVLISILAATLNGQAGEFEDAEMLYQATCEDLREIMMGGRQGEYTEGRLQ